MTSTTSAMHISPCKNNSFLPTRQIFGYYFKCLVAVSAFHAIHCRRYKTYDSGNLWLLVPFMPSTAGTALVAVRSVVRPNDTCALYYLPLRGNRAPTRGAPAVDISKMSCGCLPPVPHPQQGRPLWLSARSSDRIPSPTLHHLPLRGNRAPTRGAPAVDISKMSCGCLPPAPHPLQGRPLWLSGRSSDRIPSSTLHHLPLRGNRAPTRGAPAVGSQSCACKALPLRGDRAPTRGAPAVDVARPNQAFQNGKDV